MFSSQSKLNPTIWATNDCLSAKVMFWIWTCPKFCHFVKGCQEFVGLNAKNFDIDLIKAIDVPTVSILRISQCTYYAIIYQLLNEAFHLWKSLFSNHNLLSFVVANGDIGDNALIICNNICLFLSNFLFYIVSKNTITFYLQYNVVKGHI